MPEISVKKTIHQKDSNIDFFVHSIEVHVFRVKIIPANKLWKYDIIRF